MHVKSESERLKNINLRLRQRRCHPVRYPKLEVRLIATIVLFVLFALLLGITSTLATNQRADDGHGTVHEQLGQVHYPTAELTPYRSTVEYSSQMTHSAWDMTFAYKISQKLFDNMKRIPKGYLAVRNGDSLILGPKVERNDWSALMSVYVIVLIWVILWLILIIILPFIAVCYFCFCCCRRCQLGCGPCDGPKDQRMVWICGAVLVLLLVLITLGAVIAFASNRVLDRGLNETSNMVKRGGEDTCRYLQDVNAHLNHVFVYNYEELEAHLDDLLANAYHHIFLDLADTSESNAIEQLERIFDNMNEARALIRQVDKLEKDLRFYATQLRDGVRGAKRDVNYVCSTLVTQGKCRTFLMNSEMEFVDTSTCLHLDNLPDTSVFVESMNSIIKDDIAIIPKLALQRFQEIGVKIQQALNLVAPAILKDVKDGRAKFQMEAARIMNRTEELISFIQMKTMRSTQSFEDVYDKFGINRTVFNIIVCALLILIVLIMLAALLCGCLRNKGSGATCLLFGMILIFVVFSFIALIGLFYFIMGLVTYHGACAPIRDLDKNAIFRELDARVYTSNADSEDGTNLSDETKSSTDLRMSTTIKTCRANESLFDLLREYRVYNVDNVRDISVLTYNNDEDGRDMIFDEDLSGTVLITQEERTKIETARNSTLGQYNSILYLRNMCQVLTPNLATLADGLRQVRDDIAYNEKWEDYNRYARTALSNEAYHLDAYNYEWTEKILTIMTKIKQKLSRVDDLILYERRTFSNSIKILVDAVVRSEEFLKTQGSEFINSLSQNLTDVVDEQIYNFKEDIITECTNRVGRCQPLAYIYNRGVDLVCYRLVDPLNGFWLGLLLATLILLPLLLVAHKLMCTWRRMHSYEVPVAPVPDLPIDCPGCSGTPYLPPPIITCGGGQQTYCICRDGDTRTDGGASQYDSSSIATSDYKVAIDATYSTAVNEVEEVKKLEEEEEDVSAAMKPKND